MTKPTPDELRGMTTLERLVSIGKHAEFEAAARKRDRRLMVELLGEAAFPPEAAEEIADAVLANPGRYGY